MLPLDAVLTITLLVPSVATDLALSLEPDTAVIGETMSVRARICATDLPLEELTVMVEAGRISALRREGDGSLVATWTLPTPAMPRRYAAAVIDRRQSRVAFATLPLWRRAAFDTTSFPNGNVRIAIDGAPGGEGVTDAAGKLTLSVVVPAGAPGHVTIEHLRDGMVAHREELVLGTADELRVWSLALSDARGVLALRAFAYRDSGRPVNGLAVTARHGETTMTLTPMGNGLFDWTLDGDARMDDAVWVAFADANPANPRAIATRVVLNPTRPTLSGRVTARSGAILDVTGATGVAVHTEISLRHRSWPAWLHLIADAGFIGWPGNNDRGPDLGWDVPLLGGANASFRPHPRWDLAGGVGGGARISGLDRTAPAKATVKKGGTQTRVAGLIAVWGEVSTELGPGAVVAELRSDLCAAPAPEAGWGSVSLTLGYRLDWRAHEQPVD